MDGVPKITFNCIPKYIKNGRENSEKKTGKNIKTCKTT